MQNILKAVSNLPIIQPLLALLKSEKFVIALIVLIVDGAISQWPALEPVRAEMIIVTSFLGAMLIAGRFYETLIKGKVSLAPLWGPILALLRSRKFMIAVGTLLINIAVGYFPELEKVRAELMAIITIFGGTLIAAIAYEDGQTPQALAPAQYSSKIAGRFETQDLNEIGGAAVPGLSQGVNVEAVIGPKS